MRIKKLTLLAILATTLSGCSHITKQDSWNFIKSVGEAAWEKRTKKNVVIATVTGNMIAIAEPIRATTKRLLAIVTLALFTGLFDFKS